MEGISRTTFVEFGTAHLDKKPDWEAKLSVSPQPSFNKNFELFAKDLRQLATRRYQPLIFSDQAKQVERNLRHL